MLGETDFPGMIDGLLVHPVLEAAAALAGGRCEYGRKPRRNVRTLSVSW
ncbi:MAG: hypothetical protein AVDCRST_MAG58-3061 [uncultured Rubrobacteraceae bacterium]|uniref:Uncharacterized protein n=1 Tax=uncultured Rubrobacteraceae bacterium TaxID=349277 RepID=A0A6J4RB85_9ACTN|nr:MAG: hypothetical protein AVDCRST_MAG58-3061 [uncultured Rubrobacteraceae bacterium]